MLKEHASWPLIGILAEAAAFKFHNRVIRDFTKRKIESTNMAELVVTAAPVNTLLDTSKVVRYLRMSRQSPKIRTLTDTMPMSVDNIVEGEESKMLSSSDTKIPTAARLYATYSQDKKKLYKAVIDFFYVLFVLMKNGWLCSDDYLDARTFFCQCIPITKQSLSMSPSC